MSPRIRNFFSSLGVLAAAVASVATSAPEPDWVADDEARGEVTLTPDAEETKIRVTVLVENARAALSMSIRLDPEAGQPSSRADQPMGDVPIRLFIDDAVEVGGAGRRTLAIPSNHPRDSEGFEETRFPQFENAAATQTFEYRIHWEPAKASDRDAYTYNPDGTNSGATVQRPLAPRQATKIAWKAHLHAEGNDDKPRDLKLDVNAAP